MDTKPSKENGSDKSSSQSAGSIARRSRLKRTLLFAGVFALLAMLFVPSPRHGYRLIFDTSDTSVALFQLLLNVSFAALAGAIVANLSKRALYVIGTCIAIIAVGVGLLALVVTAKDSARRARTDEIFAERLLQLKENQYGQKDRVELADDKLRSAAKNWRLAWRSGEAKRVEAKADEIAKMSVADRSRINQGLPNPFLGPEFPDIRGKYVQPKPTPSWQNAPVITDLEALKRSLSSTPAPIRKALPVSPTPAAAKSPAIPHNRE